MMIIRVFILLFVLMIDPVLAQDVPQNSAQIKLSFAPLVKKVAPSVVNIYTRRVVTQRTSPFFNDQFFDNFFGDAFGSRHFGGTTRQRVQNSLGSGVIIAEDGMVVTNAHVIKDADEITVVLMDGREFDAHKLLVDEPSDLALLLMDTDGDKALPSLPYVELKRSEGLEVGDLVLAIGNPFGIGQSVTSGIVSAQARSSLNINDFNFFIQTDAAINPGNSGGPLVDMDGDVVGINSAIYSHNGGSLGLGFAVPSEMVMTLIAAQKSGQSGDKGVIRPWLGITAQTITSDIAESLALGVPQGVLVAGLHSASPLKKAGIKVGDIILALDGKNVREPAGLKFRMAIVPLGNLAQFDVLQRGKNKSFDVLAITPPEIPPRKTKKLAGNDPLNGAIVAQINPAVSVELDIDREEGVVVMEAGSRSPSARVVAAGDVIVEVNGRKIEDIKGLRQALKNHKKRESWQFIIERDGRKRQVVLR